MASGGASFIAVLANVIVMLTWTATSDINLSPLLSPFLDDVCKGVECGKGTCKPSRNSTFLFECGCDPGWMQTRPQHDNNLKFLPCVIPNCSINYSCMEAAAPPVQDKDSRANKSILDPCHWTDCGGGGTCNTTSPFTYTCQCRENSYNLLNVSVFPCFKECSLGADCKGLGMSVMNKSTPTSNLPDNGTNKAASTPRGYILRWLIVVVMVLAAVAR